jgi:two-component system cell cycle response regulator DivK
VVHLPPRTRTTVRRRRPFILVVDDDHDARTIYRDYLRAMGCRVTTARDGESAIAKTSRHHVDLIVMDLVMPRMDGWTATRILRQRAATRWLPIVALTAMPTSRDTARKAGCNAYLAKPCLPDLLWWEIRVLLGLSDQTRRRDSKSTSTTSKRIPRPPLG